MWPSGEREVVTRKLGVKSTDPSLLAQSRPTWHILVCNYKIHIFQIQMFPLINTRARAWVIDTECRLRARLPSICYWLGEISLLSSQRLLQTNSGVFVDIRQWPLQLDCRTRNIRQSPPAPANEICWFAGLTKEITAELSWAFLYNNNLGDCSTMNGTVPLSAELRENVIFFSVKLKDWSYVCSKGCTIQIPDSLR